MTLAKTRLAYRDLPDFFYSDIEASSALNYQRWASNPALADAIGLPKNWLESESALKVLSGQQTLSGDKPLAMAYAGHQFGHWSGLLGDGRASLVGDIVDSLGVYHELHLKGSGPTPYSRRGDGKATLGSAIREYLVSESLHALGIPTTRALSILTTGENIMRNDAEPGAILCRSAKSHIRVGTFQLAAASQAPVSQAPASQDNGHIKALADFTIERLYPDAPASGPERYLHLLRQAIAGQVTLISKWMGFGFIHGVMNTDNALLSGETIDYGPCAFMDAFHPGKVFSSIDRNGRYAWNRQPEIANWNMVRLAESLLPLLGDTQEAQSQNAERELEQFSPKFIETFNVIMARKFGLAVEAFSGGEFLGDTFGLMTNAQVDYTLFFRRLTQIAGGQSPEAFLKLFEIRADGEAWLEMWKTLADDNGGDKTERLSGMRTSNPIIIARNHRVEAAISAANNGNMEVFEILLKAITNPFAERDEFAQYETPPDANEVVRQTYCGT